MVKNWYYWNENLDLVRDRIKVCQMNLFTSTNYSKILTFKKLIGLLGFRWFDEFPWVCYSQWEDGAYYVPCALFYSEKSLQKTTSNMAANNNKNTQKTSKCSNGDK